MPRHPVLLPRALRGWFEHERGVWRLVSSAVVGLGLMVLLLLPFSLTVLHATEFEYGLQEGLTSVGFVVGSLLMARLADRLREGQWIAIGGLGMATAFFLYALSSSMSLALVFVIISGFMNAQHAIGRRLAIQRNTTSEVRGRVSSALTTRLAARGALIAGRLRYRRVGSIIGVRTRPMKMVVTWMPSAITSVASVRENASSAALLAT